MDASKKCPKCGGTSIDDLASSEIVLRFQCKNVDCLHQWNVPKEGLAPTRPSVEEMRGVVEENGMAKSKEKCDSCGEMVSTYPPVRAKHLRRCSGSPAASRKPAKAKRGPYKRRPAAAATIDPNSALAKSLEDLKASREQLVKALVDGNPDVLAFDKAIAALEGRPT